MQAKHTSRALKIFIGDTSIMMALWRNWKLLVRVSQTMREYSS
jgi:TfoX/Sxy family transcriptional regulator of competence genes